MRVGYFASLWWCQQPRNIGSSHEIGWQRENVICRVNIMYIHFVYSWGKTSMSQQYVLQQIFSSLELTLADTLHVCCNVLVSKKGDKEMHEFRYFQEVGVASIICSPISGKPRVFNHQWLVFQFCLSPIFQKILSFDFRITQNFSDS